MSVSASPSCTPKSEKYKINSLLSELNINDNETETIIDAAEIAVVLQTIGFKLLRFEKVLPENNEEELNKENNDLVVSITCGKSGLKTVLARQDYDCNCTNIKLAKKQDCPTDVSNENQIKEEFKLVLPKISVNDLNLTRSILSYLFLKNKPADINQNEEEFKTPVDQHKTDNKQKDNWEVDPKTSPPTLTSSPIPKPVEAPPEDKDRLLEELLSEAKFNIEKALSFISSNNNTFTKRNVKRVSNIAKIPQSPRTPRTPRRSSICNETATIKKPNTPKIYPSPLNSTTKLNNASHIPGKITPKIDKKPIVPSRIGSFRKPADKIVEDKKKLIRSDTPRPGSVTPKTHKYPLIGGKNGSINQPLNKHNLLEKNKSPLVKPKSAIPSLSKIPNLAYKKFTGNK